MKNGWIVNVFMGGIQKHSIIFVGLHNVEINHPSFSINMPVHYRGDPLYSLNPTPRLNYPLHQAALSNIDSTFVTISRGDGEDEDELKSSESGASGGQQRE